MKRETIKKVINFTITVLTAIISPSVYRVARACKDVRWREKGLE